MSLLRQAFALGHLMADSGRPQSEIKQIASRRLNEVLVAATAVPHFRRIMAAAGYDPRRDYRGPLDLALFPIMRKEDLKAAPGEFVRQAEQGHLDRHFSDKTSGSTGMPLTVYRCERERAKQVAKWLRVLMTNGYRFTDKVLSYTSPSRLAEGGTLLRHLGLLRRRAVSTSLAVSESTDALLEYHPDVVYGVRTSLVRVADDLVRRGLRPPRVKLLVAGGEVIDEDSRELCRRAFGTDITETYGSIEMGVMAYQRTGQPGLNLIDDCTYFEFLDEAGRPAQPGQLAHLVVTDLFGWLMPFVRYDQGDLVVYRYREAPGGERLRFIERIVGRQDDICQLPNGSSLSFLDFYDLRYMFPGIRQFRVTQHMPLEFIVEIASEAAYFDSIHDELVRRLAKLSPLALAFDVCHVERIDPDPAGKLRMLVSRVSAVGKKG